MAGFPFSEYARAARSVLLIWSLIEAMMRAFSTLVKAWACAISVPFGVGVGVIADVFSVTFFLEECQVRPLKRQGVSKGRSAAKFRSQIGRTKAPNVMMGSQRGGWRL